MKYCGNEETYQEVLKDYAIRGEHNWIKIEELYQAQDWKNYTVEVHGIKSAMKTIGAMETSAEAKALETAGKAEDISYIKTHHEQMMEHFVRDIQSIQNYFSMPVSKRKQGEKLLQNASVLSALNWDAKELQEKIYQLEEAAYAMDKEQMLDIIEQLGNGELLEEARRKIEREDYLSAYEMIAKEGENTMAYVIGDFSFDTEEEAKEAQREVQAISYIMKQINTEDPQAVLAAYQQMVKKNLFHTKLGIGFLEDMRKQLLALPEISDTDVPEIPQIAAKQENEKRILIKEDEAKHAEEDKKIKKKTESKIQSSAKTQDKAETKQKIDAKQEQAREKRADKSHKNTQK